MWLDVAAKSCEQNHVNAQQSLDMKDADLRISPDTNDVLMSYSSTGNVSHELQYGGTVSFKLDEGTMSSVAEVYILPDIFGKAAANRSKPVKPLHVSLRPLLECCSTYPLASLLLFCSEQ